jgi:transporter family protein
MDRTSLGILAGTIAAWGAGSFVQKLAANRLGAQSAFWHALGYAPVVIIFSLLFFKWGPLMRSTPSGASLALLGGALSSFGLIGTYLLLTRAEASRAIPLTALYPALTSVLAIIFLHESKDPWKLVGIALSLLSVYLLTR